MQSNLINPFAVLAAALSSFVVGGLWYSPLLFGKAWMRANRFTDAELRGGNQAIIFGLAFVCALVMATNLAFFLAAPQVTIGWGAAAGALAGAGWVAMAIATLGLFERRAWRWILINGAYPIVSLVIMGIILAAWRN